MKNENQNTLPNIAIILAGGCGSRMGGEMPKQFLPLCGKTVLEHSVDAFQQNGHIDEIAIVCATAWKGKVEELAGKNGWVPSDPCRASAKLMQASPLLSAVEKRWSKLKKILPGGKERYHSTLSAIEAYRNSGANLIFHDAARPLVSQRIINEVAEALRHHRAVDVALPCTDTILKVKDGFIEGVPDRNTLMRSQTPQAFHIDVIAKAYEIALRDKNFSTTDDCGVVLRYLPEVPVFIVQGDELNLKITYPQDLQLLEFISGVSSHPKR